MLSTRKSALGAIWTPPEQQYPWRGKQSPIIQYASGMRGDVLKDFPFFETVSEMRGEGVGDTIKSIVMSLPSEALKLASHSDVLKQVLDVAKQDPKQTLQYVLQVFDLQVPSTLEQSLEKLIDYMKENPDQVQKIVQIASSALQKGNGVMLPGEISGSGYGKGILLPGEKMGRGIHLPGQRNGPRIRDTCTHFR